MTSNRGGSGKGANRGKGGKPSRESRTKAIDKKIAKQPEKLQNAKVLEEKAYKAALKAEAKEIREERLARQGLLPVEVEADDLNATGIDDALYALSLTVGRRVQIYRHPERKFKAAYDAYEKRRLEEMEVDRSLRR